MSTILDLTEVLEQLKSELRAELLTELRAVVNASAWPDWMNVETAARYLDCTPERVRKLIARRAIPFHQDGRGCRVFLRRSDLDTWLEARRIDTRPR